jgi:hypothetical protein
MFKQIYIGFRKDGEELRNLYALSYIIRVIKSRTVRWAGHAVRIGEMRCSFVRVP